MITYCTNIHPGENWDETLQNLRTHMLRVKMAVAPSDQFPVGLRLSNIASMEIDESTSREFLEWCQMHNCYVPTINGFPYGFFHSSVIKEKVYLPDWRSGERVEYTKRLAGLLDTWLPQDKKGSISTVPVGFQSHILGDDYSLIRQNLMSVLVHLDTLKQKSGKEIILALEPEPGCELETTRDVIEFFERMEFPDDLAIGIGICFDCCHQAIQFENPRESLAQLSEAGIRIGKVQVSSALRMKEFEYDDLSKFSEPSYLHQVVIMQKDGILVRYNDIHEALKNHKKEEGEEWRIHFHLPVFIDNLDMCGTTRYFIEELIPLVDKNILLEIETYTWNVLPPELQTGSVVESIIREIKWVQNQTSE